MSDLLTPLTVEKLLTYKQTLPYKAYLYDTDGKSYLLVSLTNAAKVGDDPEDPASYTWSVDTSASATLRVYDTDGKSYLELVGTVSGSGTSFSGFTFTSAGTSNGSNVHLENANGDAYENTATITGSGTSFSDFGAASITLQANSGRFIVLSQDKLYAKGICVQNAVLSAVSYDGVTAERRTPASPSSTSDFIEMYKNINRSIVKHIVVVFQGDGDVRSYNNWTADVSLTNLAASGNYMEQSTKNGDYMKLQSAVVSSDGTYSGTTFNVCSNLASNTSKVQRVYSFGVYLVKVSPAYTYNAFLTPDTFKLSWK